jgi:hypothetical protein
MKDTRARDMADEALSFGMETVYVALWDLSASMLCVDRLMGMREKVRAGEGWQGA